jgi:acyl carrier protein
VTVSEDLVLFEIGRVVREDLGIRRDVKPADRLVDDLSLDSITLTTLAVALEDRFKVYLSDEGATKIETVGELARLVVERAGNAGGGS